MIGFILGIFATSQLSAIGYGWALIPIGVMFVLISRLRHASNDTYRDYAFQSGLCAIGVIWFCINAQVGLSHRLTNDQADQWLVTGTIDDLVLVKDDFQRFRLKVDSVERTTKTQTQTETPELRYINLNVYHTEDVYQSGDAISVIAKLKPPHGYLNPKAFDLERHAFIRRIDAQGYVKTLLHRESAADFDINKMREAVSRFLDEKLKNEAGSNSSAIHTLKALWIGDKRGLEQEDWRVLQVTGTAHLWVVSGLHIGLCVLVGLVLGRVLSAFIALLFSNRVPIQMPLYTGVLFALLLSGFYVLLAGSSLPTQRAWLMAAVVLASYLFRFEMSVWRRWLLALSVILIIDPLAIYEPGLWLSFWAVASLILLSARGHKAKKLTKAFQIQCLMGILMMPLMISLFDGVSWISPWVNLWAIPLMMFILILSVLAGGIAYLGWDLPLQITAQMIDLFWNTLVWHTQAVPNGFIGWSLPQGSSLWLILAMVCLLMKQRMKWLLVAALLLPVFYPAESTLSSGEFEATLYDIGQGTSVLIQTPNHRLLYDTGTRFSSGITAFERAVWPEWESIGLNHLDKLIVSHSDTDHIGGASFIMEKLAVTTLEHGSPWKGRSQVDSSTACHDTEPWMWDQVRFQYLSDPRQTSSQDTNQHSCVLLIEADQCSLLLMGDADAEVEQWLEDQLSPVDWLVAGHHGSKSSTSRGLLSLTDPKAVLISAGFLNRYHHPHPSVVERINEFGAALYRTDRDGAIYLKSSSEGCSIDTFRQRQKRIWSKG